MHGAEQQCGYAARWWEPRADGRIECRLCPRRCKLRDGARGACFGRVRVGDHLELSTYGQTSGLAIDPIEKKPLYHYFPGSRALSFGTVGCNLRCAFCQNWEISQAATSDRLSNAVSPAAIAGLARWHGCRSVAFTYNEPVIFAEYAIDVARACRAEGVGTVAVTSGYIEPAARREFFAVMDAANVDLKAFDDAFYRRICHARLQPVLDTLRHLRHETDVWLEVTTLLIPGENDTMDELDRASDWFAAELGPDVPWHFTAYHPAYRFKAPRTTAETLALAHDVARAKGMRYVYLGNLPGVSNAATSCPTCGRRVIARDKYQKVECAITGDRCVSCGQRIPGRFAPTLFTPAQTHAVPGY